MPVALVLYSMNLLYSIAINFVGDATKSFSYRRKTGLICFYISSFHFLTIKLLAVTRFNALLKLVISRINRISKYQQLVSNVNIPQCVLTELDWEASVRLNLKYLFWLSEESSSNLAYAVLQAALIGSFQKGSKLMPSSRRVSKTWRPLPHDNIRVRQIAFWSQIANDFINVPVMSICNNLEGLEKLFAFHFDAAFPFLRRYFIWPYQSACRRARGWNLGGKFDWLKRILEIV